jgi:UDP-glucose 4-epimerase
MKKVLLTGATGFVGANLCRRLLQEGHEVHCLVRQGYTAWRLAEIRGEIRLHSVDLNDAEMLEGMVAGLKPEWIFHLATYGAYSWQTDVQKIVQTNFLATVNLVEACLKTGFEIFINTGSSSEYGYKDHAPLESEGIDPNSYYAVTKASATHYCRYSAARHGAGIPTLRLYSVYGPYEEPGRLIPQMILHGLHDKLPPLVNPQIARDYIDVRDVADAYLRLAALGSQAGGEIYNLGTGVQTSLADVAALSRRVFGLSVEPQWGSMPARDWDTSVWKADIGKISARLGWQPTFDFETGFYRTVDWFREHPEWMQFYESRTIT